MLLAALMTGMTTGCQHLLTERLWNSGTLQTFCEPAAKPNLQISRMDSKGGFLVEYDEACEGSETIRRRAFFLEANLPAIQERRKPHFISRTASDRTAVPVITNGAATNLDLYASVGADPSTFSIHSGGKILGTYQLPVYESTGGRATKYALTPLAVIGDIVIVGSVFGFIASTVLWPVGHSIKT
jgi:hypothetical protein